MKHKGRAERPRGCGHTPAQGQAALPSTHRAKRRAQPRQAGGHRPPPGPDSGGLGHPFRALGLRYPVPVTFPKENTDTVGHRMAYPLPYPPSSHAYTPSSGGEAGRRQAGGGEARGKGGDSGKGMRAGPVTNTPHLASPPPHVAPEPQPPPHGTYGRRARPHGAGSGACAGRGPPRQPVSAGRGGAGRGVEWNPLRPPVGPRAQRPGPARGGGGGAGRPSEGRGAVEPAVCRCFRVPSALRAGSPVLAPPQISRGRFGLPEESSSIPGRPVRRWHCRSRRFDGTGPVCPVRNYTERWSGKYRAVRDAPLMLVEKGMTLFP